MEHSRLSAKGLGLAGGILWGASMFVFTLIAFYTGYSADFIKLMMSVYPGYDLSIGGSFIGLAYGFADGFIGCYIFGWLYNKVS